MKILWLCNLIPAPLALELHRPVHNIGGWLNVLIDTIKKNPDYDLTILRRTVLLTLTGPMRWELRTLSSVPLTRWWSAEER